MNHRLVDFRIIILRNCIRIIKIPLLDRQEQRRLLAVSRTLANNYTSLLLLLVCKRNAVLLYNGQETGNLKKVFNQAQEMLTQIPSPGKTLSACNHDGMLQSG